MVKIAIAGLFLVSLVLLVGVAFAPPFGPPPGQDRFKTPPGAADGLVVRYPKKAVKNKPFNIGIYINDTFAGGSDYDDATMTINVLNVSGPGTVEGWNSWFEAQGLFIDWGVSDLIVPPETVDGVTYESFEHKGMVSKLGDVPGWTGSIVCKADTLGTYEFTISTTAGSWSFNITVTDA